MDNGSLLDLLSDAAVGMNLEFRMNLGLMAARGVAYLHSNGIAHRDLKVRGSAAKHASTAHRARGSSHARAFRSTH